MRIRFGLSFILYFFRYREKPSRKLVRKHICDLAIQLLQKNDPAGKKGEGEYVLYEISFPEAGDTKMVGLQQAAQVRPGEELYMVQVVGRRLNGRSLVP